MLSSFVYTPPFHIEYRMRARVCLFLISFALLFVSAALSLSLCCAADTNRDEGKRVKDASRESDICIYHIQCMCAVEKQTQRSEVRSCKSCVYKDLSFSLARAPVWKTGTKGRAVERAS